MSETEIFADEHCGCAKAVDENAPNKLFGGKRGHREIEMQNEHGVEAQSFETSESLIECFELRGRAFGPQNAYGMRRERNHRGESPCSAGAFDNGAEEFSGDPRWTPSKLPMESTAREFESNREPHSPGE